MVFDTEVDGHEEAKLDESKSRRRLHDDHVRLLLTLSVQGNDSLLFQTSIRHQWCNKGYVELVAKCRVGDDSDDEL